MGRALVAGCSILVMLGGCIQRVDLRDPARIGDEDSEEDGGPLLCAAGERVNPETGACEPCTYRDPRTVCPCGYEARPGTFPLCEEPDASFTCEPTCHGDITACNAYAVVGGVERVSDCSLLALCCDSLAADPDSTPCCPADYARLCFRSDASEDYPFTYLCLGASCCETSCAVDADCDTAYQTCDDERCVPGCDPRSHYCRNDDATCACAVLPAP